MRILSPTLTVAEVLAKWPQTAAVFNRYKVACSGCTMAPFCTLADVATTYRLHESRLLADLQAAVDVLEVKARET